MQKQFWGYKNMIKPTFYNLSDDKRKRVLQAILEEFADTDSEKISINRIIKRANISRGSFYQCLPCAQRVRRRHLCALQQLS